MAAFVEIGGKFINFDRVTTVDILNKKDGSVGSVILKFADGGGGDEEYHGEDAETIVLYLRTHKVG
jgi:hypothetical protein